MAVPVKVLPQGKRLNEGLGAALLVLGTLLAFWAFSGSQAYDIRFFYLAVVAIVLALFGSVLLANSRVVNEKRRRLKAVAQKAEREWVRLACPGCGTTFEVEGERPFTAICPTCQRSGLLA